MRVATAEVNLGARTRSRSVLPSRPLLFLLALAALFFLPTSPADARTPTELNDERTYFQLLNETRVANGRAPLRLYWDLTDDARDWSDVMAAAGSLSHDPNLGSATTGWTKLGQNVGKGSSMTSLHNAFMNSPAHRANLLDSAYDYVGIGVKIVGSTRYITVNFGDISSTTKSAFRDTDGNTHRHEIEWLFVHGYTQGCGNNENLEYCPTSNTTRAELAAFLTSALGLPSTSVDYFTDDNGHWGEQAINRVRHAGIVNGCNPPLNTHFCPNSAVTRGQLAVMWVNGFGMPWAPSHLDYFTDDNGKYYEPSANTLRYHGISYGCGSNKFCGDNTLRRDELASLLRRAVEKFG